MTEADEVTAAAHTVAASMADFRRRGCAWTLAVVLVKVRNKVRVDDDDAPC